jgi:hypothetical protein
MEAVMALAILPFLAATAAMAVFALATSSPADARIKAPARR